MIGILDNYLKLPNTSLLGKTTFPGVYVCVFTVLRTVYTFKKRLSLPSHNNGLCVSSYLAWVEFSIQEIDQN